MESTLNESLNLSSNENLNRRIRQKYCHITKAQKELLIKLVISEGEYISQAAKTVGINSKTAFSIIKNYKQNDYQIVSNKRGGMRQKKLTPEVLELIEKEVELNPGITLKGIQQKLSVQNINISISTINKGLTELKITLKLAHFQLDRVNSIETIEKRKEYAIRFSRNAPEDRCKIIFVDECGFNLHLRRSQARSKKGTRAHVIIPTIRGRNVSLVAAMNNERIIHYNIISAGNVNSERFCVFIRELQEKLTELGLQDSMVIMDNARIHKTRQVRELVERTHDLNLQFLSPYSPMLNPIENAFSKIKAGVRSSLAQPGEHTLVYEISQAVLSITSSDCNNWFFNMLMKIGPAVAGERLEN